MPLQIVRNDITTIEGGRHRQRRQGEPAWRINMRKRIYKLAVLSAILGLAVLLCVMASGAAYPHPFFQFGAPLGMLFVFVSVTLLFVSWVWEIGHNVKGKQYLLAVVTALLGLLVIWRLLSRL